MKRQLKITFSLLILLLMLNFATPVFAQQGPPPPPPEHGQGGNVPGGGAPVGEGLILLVAMGAAYGYKKWNDTRETQ